MRQFAFALPPTDSLWVLGFLGLCLGACLALSIFVTRLIIRSFQRKAWIWIFFSTLGGFILLAVWVIAIGVVCFVIHDLSYPRALGAPVSSVSKVPQIIQGQMLPYHFVLPANWQMQWDSKAFDLTAENDGLHLGVSSGKSVGDAATIARMAKDKIKAKSSQSRVSENSTVMIDGHAWLSYTADVSFNEEPGALHYIYYVYSGDEGMFQIIGWRE